MRLYHYSVTYKGGESLINDYNNRYEDAEPFILALQNGKDTFLSTYFSSLYLERQIKELQLRHYENCQKDAAEAIFEFVRRTSYADEISRLKCVYYCEELDMAIKCAMEDWIDCGDKTKEEVKILSVEIDEKRMRKYDQTFFNNAYSAVERNDFETAFANAKIYFSGAFTEQPIIEVLADGENRILEEIKY